ncbi:hypothetical protein CQA53_10440 [Helicobacter didelphidarum]|uniref:Uncharacterized protein n=1 Tax=Helicobacter didelphidarum TaxID=2040648 RepID=A0A3D8I7W3_9HELI|nr:hypothetical protein CQA53_10440 [Helicobacter didelphidarum]
MSLYSIILIFCVIISAIFVARSISLQNNTIKYIAIFWFVVSSIMLYGMIFQSSRGFLYCFKRDSG